MSKVITFSRFFPVHHPRKGEPTYFVEKICNSLLMLGSSIYTESTPVDFLKSLSKDLFHPKWHTIRAGKRWKVGDRFSPRVWSGKPYVSKQIIIAPDIEIKKIWTFEHYGMTTLVNDRPINSIEFNELARNDGLSSEDFKNWMGVHPKAKKEGFIGQILCWNEKINY